MNDWQRKKEGLLLIFTKRPFTVEWNLLEKKYRVKRDGAQVEWGRTPHLPVNTFLRYVELTHA
ncbi:MAG: hypothetical protein NC324_07260 [Bacteroides sp.]|nr:hypothetical protein [Bacteroides sp.]